MTDLLDIPLYDDDLVRMAVRFAHNVLFMGLVVRFGWHPRQPSGRDRQFAFAAVMLNITVFFICFTMKKLDLSIGMALGLFAIFGVLRYRTSAIRTKDMTYLFVVIGIAVVNALTNQTTSYLELLAVNGTIVGATFIGEWLIIRFQGDAGEERTKGGSGGGGDPGDPGDRGSAEPGERPARKRSRRRKQAVQYDRLELLAPERRAELIEDLRARTYLPIDRVRIIGIDLVAGRARLSAWYKEPEDAAGA